MFPEKEKTKQRLEKERQQRKEEKEKEKEEKITLADELHKPIKRFFPTRRIIVNKINDTWTADLMYIPKNTKSGEIIDLKEIKKQEEEKDRTITASERQTGDVNHIFLVVLDIFSRYAWVKLIKNSTSDTVAKAFKEIFKSSNSKPKILLTDQGAEFSGLIDKSKEQEKTNFQCSHCEKYFKTSGALTNHKNNKCPVLHTAKAEEEPTKLKGVELRFAYGRHKAAIAERFIKTIKEKIGRWMTNNNSSNFTPVLDSLVKEYNETPHSNFKRNYTPTEARDPKNEDKIYNLYYSTPQISNYKTDLKVDDLVRVQRRKGDTLKEKGYTTKWTKEILKIYEIKETQPPTFYLKDAKDQKIKGPFYREELQKTKFKMTEDMGFNKPRTKNNVMLGLEAQLRESYRQTAKKGRQRERQRQQTQQPQPSTSQAGRGVDIIKSLDSDIIKNIPIKSLTNHELVSICQNFKGWRGVFSRDTLPDKLNIYECGIVNLDDSEGPGTHWVAYHRNKKLKFYFDSYGLPPPLEIKDYLKSPILYSTDQIQDPDSVICGHLCVYVLEKLSNGWHIQPVINHLLDLKEKLYI